MTRAQLWASGGGTQSAAIAALICMGELTPDLAVIADTGMEQSTTWAYMDEVISPALARAGVTLHRVSSQDYATVGVWGGKDGQSLLIPAFTTQSGEVGKLPGYCSNEWKRRVVQRWARGQAEGPFEMWLGISTDEMRRVTAGEAKWKNRYPLIERNMSRADCVFLVQRLGWPPPPRSSCWMCPNHTQHEWRQIRDEQPQDWHAAVMFDARIRERDAHAYVHSDCVPLQDADLSESNGVLFGHSCQSGLCFV